MSVKTQQLAAVYAKIPKLECKGLCSGSCGPIAATELEFAQVEATGGKRLTADPKTLDCSMLMEGRCSAYRSRPLICRLFGVVPRMRCPFGCVPARWLTDAEAFKLFARVERVGGKSRLSDDP